MNRIKQLRKEKKLSQLELAQKLGVAQSTLSTWETGRFEPDSKSLIALSEIFDVTVDCLLNKNIVIISNTEHRQLEKLQQECYYLFSMLSPTEQELILAQMQGIIDSKAKKAAVAARNGEYKEKEISAETAAELEKIINEV